ncbi:MAG: patatin-like phospholipase family protein [Acetobacteraceae bacterium]
MIGNHHGAVWNLRRRRRIALALQGGGAHGAFAAGVLDRLLETGLTPDRISGVSSGALIAVMLAQGWAADGAAGARQAVGRLWDRVATAHAASGIGNGPLASWLWGADLSANPLWQGVATVMQLFSPEQLNPLGRNPLRSVVTELLDRDLLTSQAAPRLVVGATDVETGIAVLFRNEDITVDVLLASTCLPFLFPPVELEGRLLWDGAYSANPPLQPLLEPEPPDELVLIRTQPRRRRTRPTTQAEIFNRLNEIAFQRAIESELAALPRSIRLTNYEADAALADLPITSKVNADGNFLRALFAAGRASARQAEEAAEPLAAD